MNFTIKKINEKDLALFIALIRLFEEMFQLQDFVLPSEKYLESQLLKDGFIAYVALANDTVVGGLTAHVLPSYYFESSEIYLYDLAVEKSFQRKGLGSKLVIALKEYCRAQGLKEVFVQADVEDIHAIEFYHSLGGNREEVVHFNFPV